MGSMAVPSPLSRLAPYFSTGQATLQRPGPSAESTAEKRKRTARSARRKIVVDAEGQGPEAEEDPLRTPLVGDDHQVHIPDMLPASVRSTGAPAAVSGDEESAKLVRKVLDWKFISAARIAIVSVRAQLP